MGCGGGGREAGAGAGAVLHSQVSGWEGGGHGVQVGPLWRCTWLYVAVSGGHEAGAGAAAGTETA